MTHHESSRIIMNHHTTRQRIVFDVLDDFPDFCVFCVCDLYVFMVSQRSGRHLKSFLEAVRFILTEDEHMLSHMDPIRFDLSFFDARPSMFLSLFDAKVDFTGPRTHLERCGWNFCVGWWSRDLHTFSY